MVVRLADINGEISELVSPGFLVDDIIYRNCQLFLAPHKDCAFPEDFIQLFDGKIQTVKTGASYVDFTIVHPEDLKRSDIFVKIETTLTQRFRFQSYQLQDLFYQQRGDVAGTVQVHYISGGTGQTVPISVAGNLITVSIDAGTTWAKSIKAAIENDPAANQLVTVTANKFTSGNPQNTAATISMTSDTEIFVTDISQFLDEVDPIFRTYVKIGNEIVRYTGIDTVNSKLTGVTRAELGSVGETAEVGDEVFSFYTLGDDTFDNGNAINLALWVLLSGGPNTYASISAKNFLQINPTETVTNAIFFDGIDIKYQYNIQAGDFVSSTGASNGSNNFSGRTVEDVITTELGSYIVVSGSALTLETNTAAVISFSSQYNILPTGVGLLPKQVDIDQFIYIRDLYTSNICTYQIYLKESIVAKDLINKDILVPSALYSIPRKGKISVSMTAPPMYQEDTQILDLTTVINASKINIERSLSKYFYNAIVYKFNLDSLEEKYLSGIVTYSVESTNRIEAPDKAYVVQAGGLRDTIETRDKIDRNIDRFLDRYKFAAESLKVQVPFKIGWNMEVGDSVIFGDSLLQTVDITTGNRQFKPRIFEVLNKDWNIKSGEITITIVDTAFDLSVRYGVFSPSTILGSGSTTTSLVMTDSFGIIAPRKEKDKWSSFIGRDIKVHNADYSYSHNTTIQGFDGGNDYLMNVTPALPSAPAAGCLIDIADYDDVNSNDNLFKLLYVYFTPTLTVTSGVSTTQFNVSLGDAAKLFVGTIVRVHHPAYTVDSGKKGIKVLSIVGTLVTLESSMGFTPGPGEKIDLVGFVSDDGVPYGWV